MSAQSSHGMPPPDFSKIPLMMMNRGNQTRFPASPMHNNNHRLPFQHPRFGLPCFNQPPPWGSRSERNNFNGSQTALRSVSPRGPFTPDNIFGADGQSYNSGQDSFPFPGHQNNFGMNGSPFQLQGHQNQGRGGSFMRGNRGGPRLRGGGRGGFNGQQFRGQQDQGGHNKKRKEKIDKRDLPENNVFFCDICDRGFKTEEKYKEHTDGHIQCSYKDCPFIAAPKLVQLHMNMQHRSGLAKKVWSLESEEDVKKWREERKRNFPTAENIAKKKQQEAEKLARGELLHTKDFSKMRGGKNRDRSRGGRGKGKRRQRRGGKWKDYDEIRPEEMQAEFVDEDGNERAPEEIVIKHGVGEKTTNEKNGPTSAHLSSTETVKESQSIQKEKTVGEEVSGLGLLSAYGFSSSSEDEEETPEAAPKIPELNGTEILESQPHLKSTKSWVTTSLKPKRDLLPNPFVSTFIPSSTSSSYSAVTPNRNNTVEKESFTQDSPQNCAGVKDGKQDEQINKAKDLIIVNSSTAFNPITTTNQTGSKETNTNNTKKESLTDQLTGDDHIQRKINIEPVKQQAGGSKREHNFSQTSGPPSKKSRGKSHPPPPSRKYTLLEKLLAPDIRRERNKILQCVHYIVKNKFFEDGNQEGVQH